MQGFPRSKLLCIAGSRVYRAAELGLLPDSFPCCCPIFFLMWKEEEKEGERGGSSAFLDAPCCANCSTLSLVCAGDPISSTSSVHLPDSALSAGPGPIPHRDPQLCGSILRDSMQHRTFSRDYHVYVCIVVTVNTSHSCLLLRAMS